MSLAPAPTPVAARQVCGYPLRSWLTADRTALCIGPGDRLLVLQRLPDECLQGTQLHPSVRDRLQRVKELAHRQTATFLGVQREPGGDAWCVWEYVDGITLRECLARPDRTPRHRLLRIREVMLAVEGLHALGIIHGAIHPRNIIVTPTSELRLIHVSPLLHHKPEVDYDALAQLLQQVISNPEHLQTRLSRLITQKIRHRAPMLELAGEISRLLDTPDDSPAASAADPSLERQFRTRALHSAAGCVVAAMVLAIATYVLLRGAGNAPERPPEAPAQLLRPR